MARRVIKKIGLSLLIGLVFLIHIQVPTSHAATSPTLVGAANYSVLGGAAVTNVGTTTTDGSVGVSPGTSITGGTITAGGGIHSNDASAIAAQADTVSIFTAIDQTCDFNYSSGQDLTLLSPLVPGVYCSAGSFSLTGNLTLSGSGVWIFKTVSTLITSAGSSITSSDPCNVWWRVGSAATLGTTTSFVGNIVTANVADTTSLGTGATLNGRVLAQAAQTVTLAGNTITEPTCTVPTSTPTPTPTPTSLISSSTSSSASSVYCPSLDSNVVAPSIIESKRVDSDSIFIKWGPYSGVDTFNIQYGTTSGNWLYNTDVTGFSTTINALPLNQPIWVRVAARNSCTIGAYGNATMVAGASTENLLNNPLIPRLPNTGIGPDDKNNFWNIVTPAGIAIWGLASLVWFTRKRDI